MKTIAGKIGHSATRFGLFAASALAICTLVLGACASGGTAMQPPVSPPIDSGIEARIILTTPDKANLLKEMPNARFSNSPAGANKIEIDENQVFQVYDGVGAALTDASNYLLNQKLNSAQRSAILNELFSTSGIRLGFTRLTIGASDFSQTHYSYNDMPNGQTDPNLVNFSIAPARENLLPILHEVLAINPNLKIMASPWSAPGWMKTTGSMIGGSLRPEFYSAFAQYLVRYIEEMAKEGIRIDAISMQNEPHFAATNYPGMIVRDAERASFYKNHLGPLMNERTPNVRLFEWDHNWNEPSAPTNVLNDAGARQFVDAIAWHCYGGDVEVQSQIHDLFPDKDTYFTECSGGEWARNWDNALVWQAKNLIIGATRNWARGVLLWNLALDENFGPHLGGCGDCRGVITINSQNGEITRNLEYYVLGHISKFVDIGARRIASNSPVSGVENVVFKNPDGKKIMVVVNTNSNPKEISISDKGRVLQYSLAGHALATIIW